MKTKPKLRPIRTRQQCLAAGDSFRGFRPSCLPHMPLFRSLRIAWMVVRGLDLSQYDIDCGYHEMAHTGLLAQQIRSQAVLDALRTASEAFGGDEAEDTET